MSLSIKNIQDCTPAEFRTLSNSIELSSEPLKNYLKRFAYKHSKDGLYITYLLLLDEVDVGYISFANANIESDCPEARELLKIAPSMKYPVPVLKITRFAIFDNYRDHGYGKLLLVFAEILAFLQMTTTGCKALVVDSKDSAIGFYTKAKFVKIENYSDEEETTFMIKRLITVKELITENILEEVLKLYIDVAEILQLDNTPILKSILESNSN